MVATNLALQCVFMCVCVCVYVCVCMCFQSSISVSTQTGQVYIRETGSCFTPIKPSKDCQHKAIVKKSSPWESTDVI